MVKNQWGTEIDMDAALELMDCDILCEMDMVCITDSDQEYFDLYCKAHEEKYGEPFELAKENPCY